MVLTVVEQMSVEAQAPKTTKVYHVVGDRAETNRDISHRAAFRRRVRFCGRDGLWKLKNSEDFAHRIVVDFRTV